jgi:hypothetical protein
MMIIILSHVHSEFFEFLSEFFEFHSEFYDFHSEFYDFQPKHYKNFTFKNIQFFDETLGPFLALKNKAECVILAAKFKEI